MTDTKAVDIQSIKAMNVSDLLQRLQVLSFDPDKKRRLNGFMYRLPLEEMLINLED